MPTELFYVTHLLLDFHHFSTTSDLYQSVYLYISMFRGNFGYISLLEREFFVDIPGS